MTTEFMGYILTEDEFQTLSECLATIRKEKEHDRLIRDCKINISDEISDAINKIGLAETKRVVRELARELRSLNEEDE